LGAKVDPSVTKVTVIGGHSGVTIIPLISQTEPSSKLNQEQLDKLTHRIQFGGDEVVKAKDGAGSATLSMAFAGARMTEGVLKAIVDLKPVVEPAYVAMQADPKHGDQVKAATQGCEYFATNVELGPNGVEKIIPFKNLSAHESKLLEAAVPELKKNIQKGVDFVNKN
jgi:malate dehydrogenase